jgi:hypothetical protein
MVRRNLKNLRLFYRSVGAWFIQGIRYKGAGGEVGRERRPDLPFSVRDNSYAEEEGETHTRELRVSIARDEDVATKV